MTRMEDRLDNTMYGFFVADLGLLDDDRVRLDESFPTGPCSTFGREHSLDMTKTLYHRSARVQ